MFKAIYKCELMEEKNHTLEIKKSSIFYFPRHNFALFLWLYKSLTAPCIILLDYTIHYDKLLRSLPSK